MNRRFRIIACLATSIVVLFSGCRAGVERLYKASGTRLTDTQSFVVTPGGSYLIEDSGKKISNRNLRGTEVSASQNGSVVAIAGLISGNFADNTGLSCADSSENAKQQTSGSQVEKGPLPGSLDLFSFDGKNFRKIYTYMNPLLFASPKVSPDGKYVAFFDMGLKIEEPESDQPTSMTKSSLVVIKTDGTEVERIPFGRTIFAWARNKPVLAYLMIEGKAAGADVRESICLIDIETGKRREILDLSKDQYERSDGYGFIAWSSRDEALYFSASPKNTLGKKINYSHTRNLQEHLAEIEKAATIPAPTIVFSLDLPLDTVTPLWAGLSDPMRTDYHLSPNGEYLLIAPFASKVSVLRKEKERHTWEVIAQFENSNGHGSPFWLSDSKFAFFADPEKGKKGTDLLIVSGKFEGSPVKAKTRRIHLSNES